MSDRNALSVEDGNLIVTPRGLDRLWCCRRRVVVPLADIAGVRVENSPTSIPTGWRGPGLDFMGKLSGTFHPAGERHFWNYSGSGEVISIKIAPGGQFQQLHLSVVNAEQSERFVREAIAADG